MKMYRLFNLLARPQELFVVLLVASIGLFVMLGFFMTDGLDGYSSEGLKREIFAIFLGTGFFYIPAMTCAFFFVMMLRLMLKKFVVLRRLLYILIPISLSAFVFFNRPGRQPVNTRYLYAFFFDGFSLSQVFLWTGIAITSFLFAVLGIIIVHAKWRKVFIPFMIANCVLAILLLTNIILTFWKVPIATTLKNCGFTGRESPHAHYRSLTPQAKCRQIEAGSITPYLTHLPVHLRFRDPNILWYVDPGMEMLSMIKSPKRVKILGSEPVVGAEFSRCLGPDTRVRECQWKYQVFIDQRKEPRKIIYKMDYFDAKQTMCPMAYFPSRWLNDEEILLEQAPFLGPCESELTPGTIIFNIQAKQFIEESREF